MYKIGLMHNHTTSREISAKREFRDENADSASKLLKSRNSAAQAISNV